MALYAQVIGVTVPGKAASGSTVNVSVKIKNLCSETISIMAAGWVELGGISSLWIAFPDYWANVGPGQTYTFEGYFTMPELATKVHAFSYWYGSDGLWYLDDEMVKQVSLTELVYEFVIGTPAVSAA